MLDLHVPFPLITQRHNLFYTTLSNFLFGNLGFMKKAAFDKLFNPVFSSQMTFNKCFIFFFSCELGSFRKGVF